MRLQGTLRVVPLRDESDVLEHRRERLRRILADGAVSAEMLRHLGQSLADVERRLGELRGDTQGEATPYRLAA